ncbi:polyhydroxyalkanoate depolymerase, partial [bacterium]|nr:polyhydroxyalkanoate depolymerase [bacterium]
THAAHGLCVGLSDDRREHHLQPGVGHFGIFNGRRWREEVLPVVADFIARHHD